MNNNECELVVGTIRKSEKRRRSVLKTAMDGFWLTDAQGCLLEVNDAYCRMSGYSESELLAMRIADLDANEKESNVVKRIKKILAQGADRFETRHRRKDGKIIDVEVSVQYRTYHGGRFIVFLRDITERNRVEEELRRAKAAAEAVNLAKTQFLANMSHELRTPMTGILGMLQLALEEDIATVPRGYLETALSSSRALLRILNDILDMSKIEAGKLTIEKKPFSLKRCVTKALAIITPEARCKGLGFTISVPDELSDTVVGDQTRILQVLTNLIGNAVKFTESGKVEVRVTVAGTTPNGKREFTFAVTDTGIGIPDDKKGLLFQAFSQVDASHSRSFGGTGLGLTISREIVELMGGTITFESEEGVGSTFSFTIPLVEARVEIDALSAAEPQPTETKTPALEGERILRLLLAEDDPTTRQVLGLMLKRSNYTFDFAEDGQQAVEMWGNGEYDLVLMDIQMPRLNGYEATRAIREKERERGGHIPIVAVTAHAFKESEKMCLAAGMDAYISKPINFKKSLQVIGEIINQKTSGVN